MPEPLLTLGEIEPERPTVAINRRAPDGPWQTFKHRHFDVLLRWFPVRYVNRREIYEMRLPSEFGMQVLARLGNLQTALRELGEDESRESMLRVTQILREMAGMVLNAPKDVLDHLSSEQHARLVATFPSAVTAAMPRKTQAEDPSTSADLSPASAASIPATPGATG